MMQMLGFRGSASKDTSDSSPKSLSQNPKSSSPTVVAAGPRRPLRLVYCDDKGKFRMDPEAVAALQLVKGPIGVVSVCGRARQGKSFILNQLLGRSSGFQVASTHRPCTKGLWMWSAPLKRTALDGTEYYLVLLDSEGIDAYDQTGTYSTQIFSLAVLLSSMFIYNQMGGIDETALDRLSLVTEMTKHIRVRASGGRTTASELGQFSPVFVWLLRDFYLDLAEDDRKITPRDYLELALRPMQGGKDVATKNEIRESIRSLFPDRECFTLVRPLNNENDLQRLDQISLEKLRPEFRSGLDALTKFVFERTRTKQVGATVMTGPILAGITQSFLDAINNGAVPTISSSWQSVEEAECRSAYETATDVYMASFDRTKPPEEGVLREEQEGAVQKSLAAFNASAVGVGSARQKYEKLLQQFFKKAFEVLDVLLSEYETSSHGPGKWQKLATFLHQSLEGPVFDLIKKQLDQIGSEKSALMLKCRSNEDKLGLLSKQLEANEKYKADYLRRYEEAINDKKKIAEDYTSRIANLQSQCSSLEERCSSLVKALDSARLESSDWKRKYEQNFSRKKAEEDQANAEITALKSRSSAAEARAAAAREQANSAQVEASEWKRKYDIAVREAKAALEKAATIQERYNKDTQRREDALRAEFSESLAEKEDEIKDKQAKIEQAENHLMSLRLELKAAESKLKNYDLEASTLKLEIKDLSERLDSAKATAQSYEREARIMEQEKTHLEQKYQSEFKRFKEADERCRAAENEAKRAVDLADKAREEAALAQSEKSEVQRLAMERLTQIERAHRQVESLERRKADLIDEVERLRRSEMDAVSKVEFLEKQVEEREREIESLLESTKEQRENTVQVLEGLLKTERAARAEANSRAEALSLQLQSTQARLDSLQQELTSVRLNETALDSKLKTASHGKRTRVDDYVGIESVQDMEIDEENVRGRKKSKSTTSPLRTHTEDGGSIFKADGDDNHSLQTESEGHTKFTVLKLKQELTRLGFGAELLQLKNPNKKEIVALYEKHVLQK
ncbi:uncharacterized protein LOC131250797 isoform X2 [Magnolia sinica]|uniref:uncharacterized protein LOC131250797 isoform X2 n=1 Tax=Magnolia sinica TaxID=86752 RepID=UPI00265991E7|nr:uncharacterized protein LOC131250797 isoform X2 [Magnolia sinica]